MNEELKKAYQEKTEVQLKEWGTKIEGISAGIKKTIEGMKSKF